jgi:transposase
MRVVGIDTHKATLAACAIDEIGQVLAQRTFANEPAGFEGLLIWLGELGDISRMGLEGSAGYGAAAARFLLAADWPAVEVPPQLSQRERLRTRRAGKRSRRRPRDRAGDPPRGRAPAGPAGRREP